MHKRSFENGKTMFAACQCTTCHRFAGDGGSVGPDLSSVATRFAARDIIESIIEPSKVISDQYQTTIFVTKDGNAVSGRLISDDGKNYLVAINPLDPSQLTPVVKAEVQSKSFTNISTMPPGLISRLNRDEALDLIAYLLASANPQDAIFK
jgi:putative heme-binding domain-containing protein